MTVARDGESAPEPFETTETAVGTSLAYATYGDPEGTPVVFLHGTPGSRLLGGVLDSAARDRGVRVLSPDRPGYGHSELPDGLRLTSAGWIVEALADAVDAARLAVVGFSGGAPYALAAAATVPRRVRSVDLVSGTPPPAFVARRPFSQRLLAVLAESAPSLLGAGFALQSRLAARLPASVVASQYTAEEGDVDLPAPVARRVKADLREAFVRGTAGAVIDSRLFARPWPFEFEAVSRPVRLWHGTEDGLAPIEAVRAFAAALPDARLTGFERVGHLGTLLRARPRVVGEA